MSYSPVGHLSGSRTSGPPQGASTAPVRGFEPRSPPSERGVLPVGRSRNGPPLHPRPPSGNVDAAGRPTRSGLFPLPMSRSARKPNDVVQATRLPFDPGSSTAGCAVRCDRRPTWRGFGARASHAVPEIGRLKHTRIASVNFRRTAPRDFLSQAGPRFELDWFQAEHHLGFRRGLSSPKTKKATRWVALVWLVMRLED